MKLIGLTGGIGSGKSVVASLIQVFGRLVYDSDARAKELYEEDERLKQGLIDLLGPDLYKEGQLDKPLLASLIFQHKETLQAVNQLVHPAVERDFLRWVASLSGRHPMVFQESAILFEAGWERLFDAVVCVTAPEALRIHRLCHSRGMSEAEVRRRMQTQLPEQEIRQRADFVLVNDDRQALIPQVKTLLEQLEFDYKQKKN
jgi:dephospho-CoA kinase